MYCMISDIRVKGHGQVGERKAFSSKQSNMFVSPSRFDNFRDLTVLSTVPKQKVFNYIHVFLGFVVPCIFSHSNKAPNQMQQSIVKFYCFVVQTLINTFRALLCPSSGARQTAVAASGFCMNVEVEVFSAVVGLLVTN